MITGRVKCLDQGWQVIAVHSLGEPAESFHFISHYWEPTDRITRIQQLLNSSQKLSAEDMKRMQQDIYCVLAAIV